jgi:hypothetical protein
VKVIDALKNQDSQLLARSESNLLNEQGFLILVQEAMYAVPVN